jgi:hypothetical protein
MARLALQQGEHGLVATVHTVEIADGQGAARKRWLRAVPEASKDIHAVRGPADRSVFKARYIDTATAGAPAGAPAAGNQAAGLFRFM